MLGHLVFGCWKIATRGGGQMFQLYSSLLFQPLDLSCLLQSLRTQCLLSVGSSSRESGWVLALGEMLRSTCYVCRVSILFGLCLKAPRANSEQICSNSLQRQDAHGKRLLPATRTTYCFLGSTCYCCIPSQWPLGRNCTHTVHRRMHEDTGFDMKAGHWSRNDPSSALPPVDLQHARICQIFSRSYDDQPRSRASRCQLLLRQSSSVSAIELTCRRPRNDGDLILRPFWQTGVSR